MYIVNVGYIKFIIWIVLKYSIMSISLSGFGPRFVPIRLLMLSPLSAFRTFWILENTFGCEHGAA